MLALTLLAPVGVVSAQDPAPAKPAAAEPSSVTADLKAIVTKIQTKLQEGKKSEADLADELKEFDALLAKHKDEKTDEVAQVLMMKAMLYTQVLEDEAKGKKLLEQLQQEFPDSKQAAMMKMQEKADKARAGLVKGAAFPDFEVKDTAGEALTLSSYKGKVVLLDFWATWCGPCVAELPNVLEAYAKHHADGFEIIGISLDKEKGDLESFIKEKKMPWRQFFDGKGWENELAQTFGINSIPATYLLDRKGVIVGVGLRGPALEKAVAEALAAK